MSNTNTFHKTLRLTQLAVLSAIIALLTFVPYTGYISYGWLSITIIHIPVIIGAVVMGPKDGAILGFVWGLTCVLKAILAPPSPLDGTIFRNPLVAIIPRILAGLVAGLIYLAFRKQENPLAKASGAGLAALGGTVTNTILVMASIYLFYGSKLGEDLGITSVSFGGLLKYVLAAFTVNGALEIVVAIILTIPISRALLKRYRVLES